MSLKIKRSDMKKLMLMMKSFDESKHKRDKDGKFTSGENELEQKEKISSYKKSNKVLLDKIRGSKPIEISEKEITPSEDLKTYKKNAMGYGKKLRGIYVNKDTGNIVSLNAGRKSGGVKGVYSMIIKIFIICKA